ncbi:MAG: DUF362 domain-containing protein [Eubacteriales bacterium]|nr:DUF362 domain-containing protein [Eubacteriales bacterium]
MKSNEILRICGTDYTDMTRRLLKEASLLDLIRAKGKGKNIKITIKPNLVTPSPADFGATTHTEIIEGIVTYLKEGGYENITIMEGSWAGDSTEEALEYCGYNALAARHNLKVIDTKKVPSVKVNVEGTGINICKCVYETEFLINVPVLKGHCQVAMTCAIKNLKGLIPDSEKRRFHTMGLHKPIAYLGKAIPQDFIVVDNICGDPDFEEGGRPLVKNRILCAVDPVLTDLYAMDDLGLKRGSIPYMNLAQEIGIGKCDPATMVIRDIGEVDEVDTAATGRVLDVSYTVEDADSCSMCYAQLIGVLDRLKEEGLLERLGDERIAIGQGYRDKSAADTECRFGIGNCTKNLPHFVKGCPPEEDEIYEELKAYLLDKG